MSKISACIVTYNNSLVIRGVLESLKNSTTINDMDVFIVDNCSHDNTPQIVKEEYPEFTLIQPTANAGFGGGHNEVLGRLDSDYHLIINPDIEFESNAIEKMVSYMEHKREVVILTPKVLNRDGSEQHLPKRNPSIRYMLGGFLESKGKIFRKWRAEYTRSNEHLRGEVEIDFCTGCFMVVRTQYFKKVQGFDERYFLYMEDADLTRKLKKLGKSIYHSKIEVTHLWKRGNKQGKGILIFCKSVLIYFRKWGIKI